MTFDAVASFLDTLPPAVAPTREVHHKALSLPFDRAAYDWPAFRQLVGDVPLVDDPVTVKRRSRDYYWFSPIVRKTLDGRYADIVAEPRDEADVVRVASACARLGIPVVARGSGTGTYGQAVPLYGGVVLDLSRLSAVVSLTPDRVRCGAGLKIGALDEAARAIGRELRMHPSTKRIATIGGYFCGGSGGIGSVTFGGLREPGNLLGARVVTVEENPRILDLTGADCNLVNRTFGTTGIVVAVELPLAQARPWRDLVASFPDLDDALRFSHDLAASPTITKKLVSMHAAECAAYLTGPLPTAIRQGEAAVLTMIDSADLDDAHNLVAAHGGTVTFEQDVLTAEADPAGLPLYECAWGHTTLHALKVDPNISYLQALFPSGRVVELASAMAKRFGEELPLHIEFIRYEGQVAANGAQLWPYTSLERLEEIIAVHEDAGVFVANPHVFTVEEGSRHKRLPGDQLGFKAKVDPKGLLNPGKMTSFAPVV